MKSPRFNPNNISNSLTSQKQEQSIKHNELQKDSLDIKPWSSSRLCKMTVGMAKKPNSNIFSLSHHANTSKESASTASKMRPILKPKTAPDNRMKRKDKYNNLSQQMVKLGPVVTEQVLDDIFQQNLESINFYPQFRASVQQRKNLFLLKPYIRGPDKRKTKINMSTFDEMEKLKTQLYQGIKQSQQIQERGGSRMLKIDSIQADNPQQKSGNMYTNRSSVIEYMTEYTGDGDDGIMSTNRRINQQGNVMKSKINHGSISILREKLRTKYRQSSYADKIGQIQKGEATPIAIFH